MDNNRFPFITCYARMLDRVTLKPFTEFEDALNKTKVWDFGIIHNNLKSYSQYIIEFDIWNNEPSVSGGMTQMTFNDAKNCKVSIWENSNKIISDNIIFKIPCIQIKNSNDNDNEKFNSIVAGVEFNEIHGNIDSDKIGILHGNGDHTKFQIGLNFLENLNLKGSDLKFTICFSFEDHNEHINLFFNCKINITTDIIYPTIKTIKNDSSILFGKIDSLITSKGFNPTEIAAYDLNGVLKDYYISKNSRYNLFLEKGIYNINVKNNLIQRTFNNIELSEGISLNYSNIEFGLISNIYEDIIEYYNSNNKIKKVIGYLHDEYNNPINNAEIIITQDNSMVVYYKTNEEGFFEFYLENGKYDIRIRSERNNIKIIHDFNFVDNLGFFTEIKKNAYSFNRINIICNY